MVSFYSKGNYAIRIKLTLENNNDGSITRAFPVLIEGKEARKDDDKKAVVNTIDSYFDTEQ